MRLTYKFRLHINKAQRKKLEETIENCRWVYNKTLAARKDAWETSHKSLSRFDTIKMIPGWKEQKPELSQVYSQVLQEVCTRVDLAFQAFFRRVKNKGEVPGYPRFKGYKRYDSFTYPQTGFELLDNKLFLSKIGTVKIIQHRPLEGTCKTLTIRRDTIGNWYACFSCEVKEKILPPTDKVVGIDLGLTTFAVFSDGNEIKRQRWAKQDEKDIARLQRKKEKTERNSQNYKKSIHALQHAYQRQINRRRNFAHQESRKLVNEYQFIAFEDLNIVSMQAKGNKVINRGIADVAWGQFVQFTTYKAVEAGRSVVLVDPKNTTQICSGCGEIVPKDLRDRKHECPYCGLKLSRDHNAAINILARGLASLRHHPVEAVDPRGSTE
jgi:putative transposase